VLIRGWWLWYWFLYAVSETLRHSYKRRPPRIEVRISQVLFKISSSGKIHQNNFYCTNGFSFLANRLWFTIGIG